MTGITAAGPVQCIRCIRNVSMTLCMQYVDRIRREKQYMLEEVIMINGNSTMSGTIKVSGAKNSALKLMAASILSGGEVTLHNVPGNADIASMSEVLEFMGCKVKRDMKDVHTLVIDASSPSRPEVPYDLAKKLRASISCLGPLIAKFRQASVSMPGGCPIGVRSIDMHIKGLAQMGVVFDTEHGDLIADAKNLHGAEITFEFPSVGATENIVMAAVSAYGTTIIENAAREPEISDLCDFLREIGCDISGDGTSRIVVEGKDTSDFHGCTHTVIGDRIEAGTFLVGGALSGGPVTVEGVNPAHLTCVLSKLRETGCDIQTNPENNSITLTREGKLRCVEVQTLPYPGFPTDMQAQFMVLDVIARGSNHITENVFENRFMFVPELVRMGAVISMDGHHAFVNESEPLDGAEVTATDLRAGAALVLAGIFAQGQTCVHNIRHIDRGYEFFEEKLRTLGADVWREEIEVPDTASEVDPPRGMEGQPS